MIFSKWMKLFSLLLLFVSFLFSSCLSLEENKKLQSGVGERIKRLLDTEHLKSNNTNSNKSSFSFFERSKSRVYSFLYPEKLKKAKNLDGINDVYRVLKPNLEFNAGKYLSIDTDDLYEDLLEAEGLGYDLLRNLYFYLPILSIVACYFNSYAGGYLIWIVFHAISFLSDDGSEYNSALFLLFFGSLFIAELGTVSRDKMQQIVFCFIMMIQGISILWMFKSISIYTFFVALILNVGLEVMKSQRVTESSMNASLETWKVFFVIVRFLTLTYAFLNVEIIRYLTEEKSVNAYVVVFIAGCYSFVGIVSGQYKLVSFGVSVVQRLNLIIKCSKIDCLNLSDDELLDFLKKKIFRVHFPYIFGMIVVALILLAIYFSVQGYVVRLEKAKKYPIRTTLGGSELLSAYATLGLDRATNGFLVSDLFLVNHTSGGYLLRVLSLANLLNVITNPFGFVVSFIIITLFRFFLDMNRVQLFKTSEDEEKARELCLERSKISLSDALDLKRLSVLSENVKTLSSFSFEDGTNVESSGTGAILSPKVVITTRHIYDPDFRNINLKSMKINGVLTEVSNVATFPKANDGISYIFLKEPVDCVRAPIKKSDISSESAYLLSNESTQRLSNLSTNGNHVHYSGKTDFGDSGSLVVSGKGEVLALHAGKKNFRRKQQPFGYKVYESNFSDAFCAKELSESDHHAIKNLMDYDSSFAINYRDLDLMDLLSSKT